jgi:hypothetical protein
MALFVWWIFGKRIQQVLTFIPFLLKYLTIAIYYFFELPISALHKSFGDVFSTIDQKLADFANKVTTTFEKYRQNLRKPKPYRGIAFCIFLVMAAYLIVPQKVGLHGKEFTCWNESYLESEAHVIDSIYERGWVTPTATRTEFSVLVNGEPTLIQGYTIGGNSYLKLRDLAMLLNGTEKQFDLGWDGANSVIILIMGKTYTPVGGELIRSNVTKTIAANLSSSTILLNGKKSSLIGFTSDGSNYYKLRDVSKAIGFGVTWDEAKNTIKIDIQMGYTN